jgi:hypothetical protein
MVRRQVTLWAGILIGLAGWLHSCGVDEGGGSNIVPTVETATAQAEISFDPTQNLILIDLATLEESQSSVAPLFPCSVTIDNEELEYEILQNGDVLRLADERLTRDEELDQSVDVAGVPDQLFAVWAFEEFERADGVRNRITVTIQEDKIQFQNTCQQ